MASDINFTGHSGVGLVLPGFQGGRAACASGCIIRACLQVSRFRFPRHRWTALEARDNPSSLKRARSGSICLDLPSRCTTRCREAVGR